MGCHFKQILFSRSRIQWVVSLAPYSLTKVCKAIFLQLATPTHIYTQKQQQHDRVPKISEMCHEKLGRTLKRSQKVVLSLVGGHKRYFHLTNHLAFRVLTVSVQILSVMRCLFLLLTLLVFLKHLFTYQETTFWMKISSVSFIPFSPLSHPRTVGRSCSIFPHSDVHAADSSPGHFPTQPTWRKEKVPHWEVEKTDSLLTK